MTRNLFFDVLRGALAWIIVLVHVVWLSGLTHSGTRAAIGQGSVQVFMVLAGYMAIATYRDEPYGRYLAKRFWRIVPVLVVCWLLCWIVGTTLVPAWFITLIIQFYLVLPVIMWGVKRYGFRILGCLLILSSVLMLPVVHDRFNPYAPMGELLPQNLLWFVLGISLFYLIDKDAMNQLSDRSRKFRFLINAGERSYSIYLVHWPVLFLISHIIPINLPTSVKIAILTVVGVPLVDLSSLMLYREIETPAILLGRRLNLKMSTSLKMNKPKIV